MAEAASSSPGKRQRTMGSVAEEFVDRYVEIMAVILLFVPLSELSEIATVRSSFAQACRVRLEKIRSLRLQGKAFGESAQTFRDTCNDVKQRALAGHYPPAPRLATLLRTVRPATMLCRLELVTCRVALDDFRETLRALSGTLRDLRIEMIAVFRKSPLSDPPLTEEDLCLVDEAGAPQVHFAPEEVIVMKSLRRLDLSPPSSSVLAGVTFPKLMRLTSYRKMLDDKCSACNAARPSSKCGACKFFAFCKSECQLDNWQNQALGHRRVCHTSPEAESPQSIAGLIMSAAKSGQLRELDLAHYWHQNVLFGAAQSTVSVSHDSDDEDRDSARGGVAQTGAVFSRPSALKAFNKLVSLRLVRCGLDDDAIRVIAKNSEMLQCLDISLNTQVTDVALGALGELAGKLVDLRLRHNHRLTDFGCRTHLVKLRQLSRLDLRSGLKRLRPRHGEPDPNNRQRQVRVTMVTSLPTLVALFNACQNLTMVRVVAAAGEPNEASAPLEIPAAFADKVFVDHQGGVEADGWGEEDDFYETYND